MSYMIRLLVLLGLIVSTTSQAGSLTGGLYGMPNTANLTSAGPTDWVHWGLNNPNSVTRKSGGGRQISNLQTTGSLKRYGSPKGQRITYKWTNGSPRVNGSTTAEVYLGNVGNRFTLSVPADKQPRKLQIVLGANQAQGQLHARLSDGSAPAKWITVDRKSGAVDRVVVLKFQASKAGQKLHVNYTLKNRYSAGGSITLAAAVLQGGAGNNPPSFVSTGNKTTSEGQLLSFTVKAKDTDGPSPLVLKANNLPRGASFTDNGNGTGLFAWTPTQRDVNAKPYSVTFVATDNNGSGLKDTQTVKISVKAASGLDPVYVAPSTSTTSTTPTAKLRNTVLHVNFNNDPGGPYTKSDVIRDFKANKGGQPIAISNTDIVKDPTGDSKRGKVMRVKHMANRGGLNGGFRFKAHLPAADEYYMAFDIFIPNNSELVALEKLPGLMYGTLLDAAHAAGVNPKPEGVKAFAVMHQLMGSHVWSGRGPAKLSAYVYDAERVKYDEFFDVINPKKSLARTTWQVPKGRWVTIEQRIRQNTATSRKGVGHKKDGILQAWVNGKLAVDKRKRFRTVNSMHIDGIYMYNFYGGAPSDRRNQPTRTQYEYFDNFIVSTSPITH